MMARESVRLYCQSSNSLIRGVAMYMTFTTEAKEISQELYEFCLDQGYADRSLIAKWKKSGYERLCCIQPRDHNYGTSCVCCVPKHLREVKVVGCVHCGFQGCASGD